MGSNGGMRVLREEDKKRGRRRGPDRWEIPANVLSVVGALLLAATYCILSATTVVANAVVAAPAPPNPVIKNFQCISGKTLSANTTYWGTNNNGITVNAFNLPSVSQHNEQGQYTGTTSLVSIGFSHPITPLTKWNWYINPLQVLHGGMEEVRRRVQQHPLLDNSPLKTKTLTVTFRTTEQTAGFTASYARPTGDQQRPYPRIAEVKLDGECCYGTCFPAPSPPPPSPPPPSPPPPSPPPPPPPPPPQELLVSLCESSTTCNLVPLNATTSESLTTVNEDVQKDLLEEMENVDATAETVSEAVAATIATTIGTSVTTSVASAVASSVATSMMTTSAATATGASTFASANALNPGVFNLLLTAQLFAANSYLRIDIGQTLRDSAKSVRAANLNFGIFGSTIFQRKTFLDVVLGYVWVDSSSVFDFTSTSASPPPPPAPILTAPPPPPPPPTASGRRNLLAPTSSPSPSPPPPADTSTDLFGAVTTVVADFDGVLEALNMATGFSIVYVSIIGLHFGLLSVWRRRFSHITLPSMLTFPDLELRLLVVLFPPHALAFGTLVGAVANEDNYKGLSGPLETFYYICVILLMIFYAFVLLGTLYVVFYFERIVHELEIRYVQFQKNDDEREALNTKKEDDDVKKKDSLASQYQFEPLTYFCCFGASRIQGEWRSGTYRHNSPSANDDETGDAKGMQKDTVSLSTEDNQGDGDNDDDNNEQESDEVQQLRRRLVDSRLSLRVLWVMLCRRRHLVKTTNAAFVLCAQRKGRTAKVAPVNYKEHDEVKTTTSKHVATPSQPSNGTHAAMGTLHTNSTRVGGGRSVLAADDGTAANSSSGSSNEVKDRSKADDVHESQRRESLENPEIVPIDTFHRFHYIFHDVRGGDDTNAAPYFFSRHYKTFRLLCLGVPQLMIAALGTSVASSSSTFYYSAVSVLQPSFSLLGHGCHILLLIVFMPLRDRFQLIVFAATAFCKMLAAITSVGIAATAGSIFNTSVLAYFEYLALGVAAVGVLYPSLYHFFCVGVRTDMAHVSEREIDDAEDGDLDANDFSETECVLHNMEGRSIGMMIAVAGGVALKRGFDSLKRSFTGASSVSRTSTQVGSGMNQGGRLKRRDLHSIMELRPRRTMSRSRSRRRNENQIAAVDPTTNNHSLWGINSIETPWY